MSLIRKQPTSKGIISNIKSSSVNGIADTNNVTKLSTPTMGSNNSSNNASSSRSQQQQQQQQQQQSQSLQQQQHHQPPPQPSQLHQSSTTTLASTNAPMMTSTAVLPNSILQVQQSSNNNANNLTQLNSITMIAAANASGISNSNSSNASILNGKKSTALPPTNLAPSSSTVLTSSNNFSHVHINELPLVLPSLSGSNNSNTNKNSSGFMPPIRPSFNNSITNYPNLNVNSSSSSASLLNSNVIEIHNKLNDCKSILESEKSQLKSNINAQITSAGEERSNPSSTNLNGK
jgi:hypothetical protein